MNDADDKWNDRFCQSGSGTRVCIIIFMLVCEIKGSLKCIIYVSFYCRNWCVTSGYKTMILKIIHRLFPDFISFAMSHCQIVLIFMDSKSGPGICLQEFGSSVHQLEPILVPRQSSEEAYHVSLLDKFQLHLRQDFRSSQDVMCERLQTIHSQDMKPI